MTQHVVRPTWFIVGAPKAGTAAWYTYLKAHPQVYLPAAREVHHFADDLLPPGHRMRDQRFVQSLYREAKPHQSVGQVGIFYMYSDVAARRIHAFDPKAKIIAMIRNPVDLMYSLHGQLLYNGEEDLVDFAEALLAESDRAAGRRPVPPSGTLNKFRYREIAKMAAQLERYFALFPRDQIQVVVYDDIASDTRATFEKTLDFLGLPPPAGATYGRINTAKEPRSTVVRDLLLHNPPRPVRTLGRLVPNRVRWELRDAIRRRNTRTVERPPMAAELRSALQREFTPEVDRLSELTGRDLSPWYTS